MRIAGIRGDEFTVFCFAWVGCIVEPRRKGLQRGFAFADVHGDDSSDSDRQDSFLKNQMGANGISFAGVVYLIINLANVCQGLFSGSCTEKRAH